jgi:hypothetical protein
MQLTFPNGEHASVAFDHGEISIGSRAGQGVSLPGSRWRRTTRAWSPTVAACGCACPRARPACI